MVDGSMHKVVVERGGGSTGVDTAAVAVGAALTALPLSFPPSFSHSLYYLICGLLQHLKPLQELYQY